MQRILIYHGPGVSRSGYQQIVFSLRQEKLPKDCEIASIGSEEIRLGEWKSRAQLLIFPGGRDVPYHEALRGVANSQIRSFVQQGGAYLGICAGAYYGSKRIEFEKGFPLEVIAERELAFFEGKAQGAALGRGEFCYRSERGAQIASLKGSEGEVFAAYYNGGCAFLEPQLFPAVRVIASYETGDAAVIACSVGKGKVVLSGVHPEYTGNWKQKIPLLQELKNQEAKRSALFKRILKELF